MIKTGRPLLLGGRATLFGCFAKVDFFALDVQRTACTVSSKCRRGQQRHGNCDDVEDEREFHDDLGGQGGTGLGTTSVYG